MAQLNIRRLAYALGAEVRGVDFTRAVDDGTIGAIRQAFLEYQLLCFPQQDLTKPELMALASRFGELEKVGMPDPETPYITLVTERPVNGRPWSGYKGGQNWHSDKSFTIHPTVATFLVAKEIPEVGGDTMFADMYAAYETLSPTMQRIAASLEAVHDYELRLESKSGKSGDERGDEEIRRAAAAELAASRQERRQRPPSVHGVVRIHPETNRKAIYIGERVRRFVGMTEDESRPVLDFLKEHATRYEFTYRHRWTLHDLLMWDNRCTLHKALSDYRIQHDPRFMFRCAVTGAQSGYHLTGEDDLRVREAVPAG